jgi:2-hydroxycyclohexanecarboxyl-CoA dehydrogenase
LPTGLEGKTAVVTGGASGIGQAIATTLGTYGVRVAIVDKDPADATLAALEDAGRPGHGYVADVADFESFESAARAIRADLGDPHYLVNNVGATPAIVSLLETPLEVWERGLAVNLSAAFHAARLFCPALVERRSGAVVCIASTAARLVWPGIGYYNTAKAGLVAFTKTLAYELGRAGVRANCVSPGSVETPAWGGAFTDPAVRAREAEATALGWIPQPGEIAPLVAFLLSDDAGYITGEDILCDGGYALTGQVFDPIDASSVKKRMGSMGARSPST